MADYELTFITHALEEPVIEDLLNTFDCITGETHGGSEFITITAAGRSAVEAAKSMHMELAKRGVMVERLEPDLVSRRDIAERLQVETQAVGNWIRGDRRASFPHPYHEVANGVWLWTDVVEWSRRARGVDPADGLQFPTREEIDEVNVCLQRGYEPLPTARGDRTFWMPLGVHSGAEMHDPKLTAHYTVHVDPGPTWVHSIRTSREHEDINV